MGPPFCLLQGQFRRKGSSCEQQPTQQLEDGVTGRVKGIWVGLQDSIYHIQQRSAIARESGIDDKQQFAILETGLHVEVNVL